MSLGDFAETFQEVMEISPDFSFLTPTEHVSIAKAYIARQIIENSTLYTQAPYSLLIYFCIEGLPEGVGLT